MKAMLFAAGLGTRLRPLTNDRPKALVEVGGKTLLEIVIRRLQKAGVKEFIVNVHHFADKVIDYLEKNNNFGSIIHISDERDLLLDTGGALKKARHFFSKEEAFIVHNVDIISDLDIHKMYQTVLQSEAICSLAVRNRSTSRYLLFSKKENILIGWKNIKTEEVKWSKKEEAHHLLAFSGISIFKPQIFDFMPDEAVFSIIPVLLKAAQSQTIYAYPHDETHWLDVGRTDTLKKAESLIDLLPL